MSTSEAIRCAQCEYLVGDAKLCPECGRDVSFDAPISANRNLLRSGIRRDLCWVLLAPMVGIIMLGVGRIIQFQLGSTADKWAVAQVTAAPLGVAIAATTLLPLVVFLPACTIHREVQYRIWLKAAWLVNVPWITASFAFAVMHTLWFLKPAGATGYYSFYYADQRLRIALLVPWIVICVVALASWSRSVITSLDGCGIIAVAKLRDHAAWTIMLAATWTASAIYGIRIGVAATNLMWQLVGPIR